MASGVPTDSWSQLTLREKTRATGVALSGIPTGDKDVDRCGSEAAREHWWRALLSGVGSVALAWLLATYDVVWAATGLGVLALVEVSIGIAMWRTMNVTMAPEDER